MSTSFGPVDGSMDPVGQASSLSGAAGLVQSGYSPSGQAAPLLWLDEVDLAHLPLVGAKLARLGALRSRGSRVPDGFVLTVDAFQAFLSDAGRETLERVLGRPVEHPSAIEEMAQEARAIIEGQPIPGWLEEHIRRGYEDLCRRCGAGPALSTAVRSSGVTEDGDSASFAGQFDSYLGIRSAAGVVEHVRKCWASQYTARAVDYRRRRNAPLITSGIAVGVMQLVEARSAGVAFTLNPITGDRGQAVVEGNWGFGESLVSGATTPDHWLVNKADGTILEERIGAKEVWSVFTPSLGRVVEEPAPEQQRGHPCLTHEEVRRLVELAVEIEALEGRPQDVEWAIDANLPFPDSVFLLQHRPETTWADQPAPAPEDDKPYDPVAYALSKVFKVPSAKPKS